MSEQQYENIINDDNRVHVFFRTDRKKIIRFVVKLMCRFYGTWFEVVRDDSGHTIPHKDILMPDGDIERKIWYRYMNNNQALDFALDEIKEQFEFYRWRFERWLRHARQQ